MKRKSDDAASEEKYGHDKEQARGPADGEANAASQSEDVAEQEEEEALSAEEGSVFPSGERKRCRMACTSCWERKLRCMMLKNGSCLKCVERNRQCVPRVHNRRPSGQRDCGRYRLPTDSTDVLMSISALTAMLRGGSALPPCAYGGNMANAMMCGPGRTDLGLDHTQMAYHSLANPSLSPFVGLNSSIGQHGMLQTGAPMHAHMMHVGRGMPAGMHTMQPVMPGQHGAIAIYQLPGVTPLSDQYMSMMLRRPDPSFCHPQQPMLMAPQLYSHCRRDEMQQSMRMPAVFGGFAGAPAPHDNLYGQWHGSPYMEPQVHPFELQPMRLQIPIPSQMLQHMMPPAPEPVRAQVSMQGPPSAHSRQDPQSAFKLERAPEAKQ